MRILIILFFFMFAGSATGASVSGQLHIQATVPPTIEFRIEQEKQGLKITKSDVHKGFKKVDNGTVISVMTNSASGYIISVSTLPLSVAAGQKDTKEQKYKENNSEEIAVEVYNYVTVIVNGRSYGIYPGGSAEIQMPSSSRIKKTKFNYRFSLSPGIDSGNYPWPVIVTVYPI